VAKKNGWQDALSDNKEALCKVMEAMREVDQRFCDHVVNGEDFTISLELHGQSGELLHARVKDDSFRRPRGAEKRVLDKGGKPRR